MGLLPFLDNRKYLVRYPAYDAVGNVHVIEFLHIGFYVSGSHAFCVHGENFFLPALCHGILIFFDELRFKLPVVLTGDCHLHIPVIGVHSLFRMPIPAVISVLVAVIVFEPSFFHQIPCRAQLREG